MAESDVIGIWPIKEWYTLQEVADRWAEKTGKEVSVNDILHFGECAQIDIDVSPWFIRKEPELLLVGKFAFPSRITNRNRVLPDDIGVIA